MFGYLLIRALGKLPKIIQASLLITILLIGGTFFVSCTYFVLNPPKAVSIYPQNSAVLPEAGGGGATTGANPGTHLRLHAPHMNPGFRGGGGYNGGARRR